MTIPPISLGLIKGAEWLKARNAEMFSFGQAHGLMNKNAEHTSVHALAGRLQAGPNGNLELTVPSSLIKGVFDALDEPGAEFVVRNNRTESAIKVMTKEEVDKLGGTSHITERGHSYHYTLGPIVELPATGDYDKLWAISIKSNDLEDIRKSYGLETSPQLGFYIPVGCKKKKVTEDNEVSKLAGVFYHSTLKDRVDSILEKGLDPSFAGTGADTGVPTNSSDYERLIFLTKKLNTHGYGPASFEVNLPDDFPVRPLHSGLLQWISGDHVTSKSIPPEYIKLRGAENSVSKLAGLLNPWHKQVQHFIGQGYTPIAAPDGNVTFKKGDKYYSWAHDAMDGQLKEVSPADAAADLEYSGPWNEPELYHGSPKGDLQSLSKGSYVTPDLETAKLMGRFHEGTGKTWTDDDLEEPHYFGKQPKWKAGREPKGEPAIYRLIAATKKLNLLDNPYEHTTLEEMPVSKLAGAAEDPMYLHSYIPSGSIKHVKEHGLLSGNELAKPENRHLLDIARPNGDADRWLKEREERLIKSPWANTYNGPSVLFGDLDPDKIHDKHPIKKFNTTRARINLHALLKDYPTTKLEGSELIPFSDEVYDALDEKGQNEFVNKRHHTLSPEEIKSLIARGQNPKDMWKDFKDTEGKYYASDVPHAKVVTPMGKIPSKYIEFDEEAPVSKLAGLLKSSELVNANYNTTLLGRGTTLHHNTIEDYWPVGVPGHDKPLWLLKSRSQGHNQGPITSYALVPKNGNELAPNLGHEVATPMAYIALSEGVPGWDESPLGEYGPVSEVVGLKTEIPHRRKGLASALIGFASKFENRNLYVEPDPIGDKAVARGDVEKAYLKNGFMKLDDKDPNAPLILRNYKPTSSPTLSKLAGLLKQSVYWSKDVSRDLLNGRKYPLSYLTGELGELGESVKNMDWTNFKEELGDSAYAAQMILAQKLGLNLPLIGASAPVDKFYARRKGWEDIFKDRGVPFSNDYLAGGSNLKKPKKIQAALGLAGHAISKEDARTASLKYGGGIEDDWVDDIGGVSKLARLLKWAEGPASIGTPGGKPAAAPKGPSLNSTPPSNLGGGLNGNTGTMNLSGGRPQFNQGAQNDLLNSYTNFQKNNPSTANVQYPAPVQGGTNPAGPYKTNEEMIRFNRQADLANKKMTWQQVEQMDPGQKRDYDRRNASNISNEQIAADQLAGKVDPNANSPFKPSGPPLSAKNQEVANMKHYTEQAYTDRQNLKPGSVAFHRSEQQRVADETAGAIPQFVASTALAGPIGKVLGAGAKAIGGYVIPKIAPAFARWAAPAAHEAAHVAGHLGAESLLPAAYTATPTSIKSAPAWLGAKAVHEVGHQASNVSSAVGNAWNKAKGAMNSAIGPKSIPQGGTDITNTPYAGSDTNRSPTIRPEG